MATYVQVRLMSENYAIPVAYVVEATRLDQLTEVPGSPPELLGVISIRGQVLPVVCLSLLLGCFPRPGRPGQLLVARADGVSAGLAVDEVCEVGEMSDPTSETESDLLLGATLTDDRLIGVLDVPAVFRRLEGSRP